jgi:2-keto-4-pentenoate hydratase/2-oxohepta-3-ene-1,7-dioic acid hydratase in catechol pathway
MQKDDIAKGNPWFRSKSFDTFCPTGPFLVPPGVIPDPHDLEIKLTVNGQVRQQAGTSQMLFRIPQLIHAISRCMTLQPGDIIATGTPEGVSELKPGDIVDITITGLGTLRNRVTRGA